MHERLVPLILSLADRLRECAESGEHPAAAERAARRAYGECEGLLMYGRAERWWYERLAGILGTLETAVRTYPHNPEHVTEVMVPRELSRLEPLVKLAEAVREAELCAF